MRRTGALAALAALFLCAGIPAAPAAGIIPLPAPKPALADLRQASLTDGIPLPGRKPEAEPAPALISFSRPDVLQLLRFGQPPRPGRKPVFENSAAPLSEENAALYKRIFALQTAGKWDKADELMNRLTDYRLRGHVLYQRYMHPTRKASYDDLAGWLALYADHPGADRIYRLAAARRPAGAEAPRRPEKGGGISGYIDIVSESGDTYQSARKRGKEQEAEVRRLTKGVSGAVARGQPEAAWKLLDGDYAPKLFDHAEYDQLRAQIASGYLYAGNPRRALDLAEASAKRSGNKAPTAGWVGGLSAWRLGQYKKAAGLFELAATTPYASSWTKAAGAYWASRAHMRAGHVRKVRPWLEYAAGYPRTFYGLIATRSLGWDFDFNWDMPKLKADHIDKLKALPAGRRAMALVEAEQYHLAEAELRRIDPRGKKGLTEALLAYANDAGLPAFAMRIAEAVPHPKGGLYDAALYPLSPWAPEKGYKIDRALIHALIRQESRFDPSAESHRGATGLMQLMPATASFVSRRNFRAAGGRHSLRDPEVNLDIGQRYVEDLLDQDHISTELFSLIIAYNAGPGNLRKWKEELAQTADDPLLFIESIPLSETRNFVERVMANYWIYRARMNQEAPSLDAVAEGRWARYARLDAPEGKAFQVADNSGTVR